jgi:hypothetical protein
MDSAPWLQLQNVMGKMCAVFRPHSALTDLEPITFMILVDPT